METLNYLRTDWKLEDVKKVVKQAEKIVIGYIKDDLYELAKQKVKEFGWDVDGSHVCFINDDCANITIVVKKRK